MRNWPLFEKAPTARASFIPTIRVHLLHFHLPSGLPKEGCLAMLGCEIGVKPLQGAKRLLLMTRNL